MSLVSFVLEGTHLGNALKGSYALALSTTILQICKCVIIHAIKCYAVGEILAMIVSE